MASLFRLRTGKGKDDWVYAVEFVPPGGKPKRIRVGRDWEAARAVQRKVEGDLMLLKRGVLDAKANRRAQEARRPIVVHVEEWAADLRARGASEKHRSVSVQRVMTLFDKAGVSVLGDVTPSRIRAALGALKQDGIGPKARGLGAKSVNEYLFAGKNFLNWAVRDGRLGENPLAGMARLNVAVDRRRERRALTDDEIRKLLAAAERGPVLGGLDGRARATLYRLLLGTGLRQNEVKNVTPADFDLDRETLTVRAAFSKHRREDVQPLPGDLLEPLRAYLDGLPADRPAFPLPVHPERMIQSDLKRAGIPYRDGEGRVADWHALRHTFVSRLVASGANIKAAQLLARHADAGLTLNTYSHVGMIDLRRALNCVPSIAPTDAEGERQAALATGTNGRAGEDPSAKPSVRVSESVSIPSALDGGSWPTLADPAADGDARKALTLLHFDAGRQGKHKDCRSVEEVGAVGLEPTTGLSETLQSQDVTQVDADAVVQASGVEPENPVLDRDLARIVDRWPRLPEPIRRAVLALVEAVPE